MNRKEFFTRTAALTLGLLSVPQLLAKQNKSTNNLISDINNIIDLPEGFSYEIISEENEIMDDGLIVPHSADGMACFQGDGDTVILVRNHEIGHVPNIENFLKANPYGDFFKDYLIANSNDFYDSKDNKTQCFGGTTSIVYNLLTDKVEKQYLSLCGTLVNCSGGVTPWGTWITCEETTKSKSPGVYKNHGYAFEVIPSNKIKLTKARPIIKMGRFRREAVAFDLDQGDVYQTEDRTHGLFYKFIPQNKQELLQGGKLLALSIKDFEGKNCSNWGDNLFVKNKKYKVKWIELDNVESPDDTLRFEGQKKGCVTFTRGEGIFYNDKCIYFTSTNGGKNRTGQIWKYNIESMTIELFFESKNKNQLNMPDNIIMAPWGDIIVCEDGKGKDRLVGIRNDGSTYYIASNAFNNSEFAGATFSPSGDILFVNIYSPSMTIAIKGPWHQLYS